MISKNLKEGIRFPFGRCVNAIWTVIYGGELLYLQIRLNHSAWSEHIIITEWCYACVWFSPCRKGNSRFLGGLSYEKIKGIITRLHMWRQDGRHNRFPLKFPWITYTVDKWVKVSAYMFLNQDAFGIGVCDLWRISMVRAGIVREFNMATDFWKCKGIVPYKYNLEWKNKIPMQIRSSFFIENEYD